MFDMEFSGCLNDDSLGPSVQGCRGDFDFTLKFEKIFLSIVPSSIFVALALSRIVFLVRRPNIIKNSIFRSIKLAAVAVYASLHLALLVLASIRSARLGDLFIASSCLEFVSALCMTALSVLEHSRAPRPSMLLGGYLFLTLLFDITQCRSMWLSAVNYDETTFVRLFTASVAAKTTLVALESQQKKRWLDWEKAEHSPEETMGIYGLGAFMWLDSLFWTGYKKVLRVDDLFPLDQNLAAERLQRTFAKHIEKASFRGKKRGLARVLVRTLAVPFMLPVGPRIALMGFTFSQPFLIETLLGYLQEPQDEASKNIGYGLIGATILIYSGIAVSTAFYWYLYERFLYMTRGCLASVVYKKTTKTKLSDSDDSAALTLMSTDVERVRLGFMNLHEFWANTVEVALASWLLQRQLGVAFLAPLVIVALCVTASSFLARYAGPRQKAWMEKIEKRVGLTANVIGNMKHLKISGLTAPIEEAIQGMRVDELKVGARFRFVQILAVVIAFTPLTLSPVMTFAVTSKNLDVTTIFVSLSYLILLSDPLTMIFQSVPPLLAALTCLDRIQAFVEKEPREDFRESDGESPSEKSGIVGASRASEEAIKIYGGSFGWTDGKFNVQNIDVTIPASKLTLLVGPIASGKSTLCKALLGETPLVAGRVVLGSNHRRIGYCDQTPFLSNATIRENIIGFSGWDQKRYNDVIEATMLVKDIALFPHGDLTNVGSNGITISGGQKQRVSIARALYLESDLLVFDDILSGLDVDTEEQVFWRVFGPEGLLKRRKATAILCTHSIRHLPSADHIIALGSDGTLVEEGNFADLVANKKYIHGLGVNGVDKRRSGGTSPPLQTTSASVHLNSVITAKSAETSSPVDQARRTGDMSVYKHYFSSIGFWPLATFLALSAACGFFFNWRTIWVKFWSEDVSSPDPVHTNAFYVGLFALFQVLTLLIIFCAVCITSLTIISTSGATLHKAALKTVINAPLRFFTTTDSGVVTNLFSQDMTLIDSELPMALTNFVLVGLITLGMAAIIAIASPYLLILYPFLAALLYGLQKFYLATSRQLRLLDLEAKSPLYSHFIDTIKGVASIRAFGWVDDNIGLNNKLLDTSQRPAYLLAMIQRWLGFTLNVVVAVVAVVVVTIATQMRSNTGFTGASLVTIMGFGDTLSEIIRMYTMLETSIGAVSRLKSFSDNTKPENQPGEDESPPESWPMNGSIEIKGVSASYGDPAEAPTDESESQPSAAKHLALKDLNITIQAGEKVAICGRSGSGKSSTILLLLRLLDPVPSPAHDATGTGTGITIDGIPLRRIDRAALRRRIIAVPQDAVFLPDGSSFGANLDPLGLADDGERLDVLRAVDLWSLVELRGGLGAGMAAGSLSQGQRQLFSLARAILRRRVRSRVLFGASSSGSESTHGEGGYGGGGGGGGATSAGKARGEGGILLLDEVSSSVDRDTDRAVQAIIEREFKGYTVVMVSHRLEAVMDFDRVIVMDSGRVVEAGPPRRLVEVEGGRFRDLWLVGNEE